MKLFIAILLMIGMAGCHARTVVVINGKKTIITKTLKECNGRAGIVLSSDSHIGTMNSEPIAGIPEDCQVVLSDEGRQ